MDWDVKERMSESRKSNLFIFNYPRSAKITLSVTVTLKPVH